MNATAKLRSTPAHIAALEKKARENEARDAMLEIEKADRDATRQHVRAVIATQDPDEVSEVERGPIKLLARDGLLWLVERRRINAAQRMAGERYRGHYEEIHAGGGRSAMGEAPGRGGLTHGAEYLPPLRHANAREALDRARRHGLVSDNTLIWLCDEVCGKGTTLREIAANDQRRAAVFETELLVALRFLARHYGFAS